MILTESAVKGKTLCSDTKKSARVVGVAGLARGGDREPPAGPGQQDECLGRGLPRDSLPGSCGWQVSGASGHEWILVDFLVPTFPLGLCESVDAPRFLWESGGWVSLHAASALQGYSGEVPACERPPGRNPWFHTCLLEPRQDGSPSTAPGVSPGDTAGGS